MGTDIHTIVQIKKAGEWVTVVKNAADERNYELFGLLAGVRGHDGPIEPLRGLPPGIEEIEGAEHSFTWYTLYELLCYGHYDLTDFVSEIMEAVEEAGEAGETVEVYKNIRVVMGFDS
jgi:hypothetical protein